MKQSEFCLVGILAVFAVGFAPLTQAQDESGALLRVQPTEVTFRSLDDRASIQVFLGGKPLPHSQVSSISIEGPYGRMFFIERPADTPGTVILKANPSQLEVGTYKLIIKAAGQRGEVTIHAPLDTLENIVDIESKLQGVDPQTVKLQYGLAAYLGREHLEIALPDTCYEGHILTIPLEQYTDRLYVWYVNGEPALSGMGESTLRVPLTKPGDCTIRVEVKKEGFLVADWEGRLHVLPEPELAYEASLARPFRLEGPEGFERFEWKIDGRPAGMEKRLTHTLRTRGRFRIECLATAPVEGNPYALRRIVWNVTVP